MQSPHRSASSAGSRWWQEPPRQGSRALFVGAMQHLAQGTSRLIEPAVYSRRSCYHPVRLRTAGRQQTPSRGAPPTFGSADQMQLQETSKSAEKKNKKNQNATAGSLASSPQGSRPSDFQCISAMWLQGWGKAARGAGSGYCTLTVQHGMRAQGRFLLRADPQFATLGSAISSGLGRQGGWSRLQLAA